MPDDAQPGAGQPGGIQPGQVLTDEEEALENGAWSGDTAVVDRYYCVWDDEDVE